MDLLEASKGLAKQVLKTPNGIRPVAMIMSATTTRRHQKETEIPQSDNAL